MATPRQPHGPAAASPQPCHGPARVGRPPAPGRDRGNKAHLAVARVCHGSAMASPGRRVTGAARVGRRLQGLLLIQLSATNATLSDTCTRFFCQLPLTVSKHIDETLFNLVRNKPRSFFQNCASSNCVLQLPGFLGSCKMTETWALEARTSCIFCVTQFSGSINPQFQNPWLVHKFRYLCSLAFQHWPPTILKDIPLSLSSIAPTVNTWIIRSAGFSVTSTL
jgi:hypothetical protein